MEEGVGSNWVLQEFIPGRLEYSTSLLVVDGQIVDAMCMEYDFGEDVYTWPATDHIGKRLIDDIPIEHLAAMSAFLKGFSGFCNFNYKLRSRSTKEEDIAILEANPRLGGDLASDAPRERARVMFEKLDALSEWVQGGRKPELFPSKLLDEMRSLNAAIAEHEVRMRTA